MSEFNDYFFLPVAKLRGMELLIEYTSYDDSIAYFFTLPFPPQFSPSQSMAPGLFYTILAILFYLFFSSYSYFLCFSQYLSMRSRFYRSIVERLKLMRRCSNNYMKWIQTQDIFYGLVLEGELKKLGIWVGNKKGGVGWVLW